MKVKITNTLNQPLCLFYRIKIPGSEQAPLLEIALPARAMLHEVSFADDLYFEAFKEQNASVIEDQKIIIGRTNEKTAERISMDNAAKGKKVVQEKKDKVVKEFEGVASGANTRMKFEVQGAN